MFDFTAVLITGAILGAAITLLVSWLRSKNIGLKWYEWLMSLVGLALVIMAIQHFMGSQIEMYMTAGWFGALAMGIPALILFVIVWRLVAVRQKAS
ncbi:MAG: dehalogenase [Dehalococcoides mccartyi]|uniref:Dehalogenase n=2 Tax=Dehalococcoides mccartyi TaxID=61435 RepID=A0A0V8M5A2_9CHLR|nr:hypothetical protein [Dehalococcoides mccartyi]AAW39257.1 reductive dehalogenase anchoring protein, putative [Dehalococcoides mccartyi 195]KSV18931.1 dehalogenase [Dehalococcoides mccartyi]MBF4481791.1 dehalogenase [Dehalococcoides mccartyi]MBJ7531549.1 dehalogenase [Dehalococcoides mccartyi]MCF7635259.1 putative reductive dehalogenase anchoring protein [Dehalococcoides mccartyi]